MAERPDRSLELVRKVQVARVADFDEQLWPINCAILILAGFTAGIVIALSDFSDPRLLYNGWVRLVSVGLLVGLLFLAVWYLQGKMVRRVQLCILISLLVHLWLAVYLHEKYMALMALREAEARQVTDPEAPVTVPDYHWRQVEAPEEPQDVERPVDVAVAEPTEPEPVERRPADRDVPLERKSETGPEPPQEQQPSPAEIQRAELSAPRRADVAAGGQISRQLWKHRPQPNEPIPQPELPPAGQETTTTLSSDVTTIERQATDRPSHQRRSFEEPASERQPEVVRLARRAAENEPLPDVPTTPNPARQLALAAEVPRTEAAAPEPTPTVEQPRAAAEPRRAEVTQRPAEIPAAARVLPEAAPSPTTNPPAARAVAPRRRTEPVVELAEVARPARSRQALASDLPTMPAEALPLSGSPSTNQQPALASAEPAVSRQPVAGAPVAAPSPRVETDSAATPPQSTAVAPPRRAETATPASPALPPETPRIARRRATEAALPGAAPAEPSSPVAAAETGPSGLGVAPAAMPVGRAAQAPARPTPAETAAAAALPSLTIEARLPAVAARRAEPSSSEPSGAEPVAQTPASLARSDRRGLSVPSTAVAAEVSPAVQPAGSGAAAASRLEATSTAAAVTRSGAQAPAGRPAAATGAAEMAIGSAQVAARIGQPRGLGRSEPSVAPNASEARLARANTGRSVGAAPTAAQAETASLALSAQSGGPDAPAASPTATVAGRAGRNVLPSTQPALGSGAPGASGTAGTIGVAQLARATRLESPNPSSFSGGGAANPSRTHVGPQLAVELEATAPETSGALGGGAQQAGSPLEASVRGEDRQVAGLPGRRVAEPAGGDIAAIEPVASAAAAAPGRRAEAGQPQDGGPALAPSVPATLARAHRGTDLPAAAEPIEQATELGAGGIAASQGGAPSRLESGASVSVVKAGSQAPSGRPATSEGIQASGVGAAPEAALAGPTRATGEGLPTPELAAAAPLGRSASAATAKALGAVVATGQPAGELTLAQPGASSPAGPEVAAAAGAVQRGTRGELPGPPPSAEVGGAVASGTVGQVTAATVRRATGVGEPLAAAAGGETIASAPRMSRPAAADVLADAPRMAAAAPTAGQPAAGIDGVPQAATIGPQRSRAGLPGPANARLSVDFASVAGPAASTPGQVAGPRRLPQGIEQEPTVAAELGGAPVRQTDLAGLPRGLAEAPDQEPRAAMAAEPGRTMELALGSTAGELTRREGGLPVQIAAVMGPGGLSFEPSPEVGIPTRRARPESEVVHTVSRRFIVERSAGQLAVEGAVREPTDAYRQRDPGLRRQAAEQMGGSSGTERAVEMGLDFFARIQFPDGRWSLHELPAGAGMDDAALGQMQSDTAATGLALLSYLGAGYTHLDDKHRAVVRRGIDWLVAHQKPNGDLFTGGTQYAWFYSHGIAAIALCEAYGMTQDPDLREPARKAIEFLLNTQHPDRGGWRYDLNPATGRAGETDTSVTGWALMAMKSAQMAGIEVPDEAFRKVEGWLELAHSTQQSGRYVYNPFAGETPQQREGRKPSLAMTAEAMLMQMYLGRSRDDERLLAGAEYLAANLPQVGTAQRPLRDCYYWYYATQAMFQLQGDYWKQWNDAMRPIVERSQVQRGPAAGSWHPSQPVRDRWGREGGRLYVTALQLLMLEVYYRHLPLFQELSK